jgi:hypothetical protein
MIYKLDWFPTLEEVNEEQIVTYIATFEKHISNDGEAGTYDEAEFDNYEKKVLANLNQGEEQWETSIDEYGVRLDKRILDFE